MNGRLTDVIIEDFVVKDDTGIPQFWHFNVWADVGSKELIESVEGVTFVFDYFAPRYEVNVDPRYDREYLRAEIEAIIKIGHQE